MRRAALRVRRAPHAVSYWRNGALLVTNYATGKTLRVSPVVLALLDRCTDWTTIDDMAATVAAPLPVVRRAVLRLAAATLLERSDRKRDPRVSLMSALDPWNPEAGFFHTATKHVQFWSTRQARRIQAAKADAEPMPPPTKRYAGVPAVPLPAPAVHTEFPSVLLARRTWRRYSTTPVTIEELATVLGLTAGVQWWAKGLGGEVPLKTSPSGGARHPIECYVVAQKVEGLRAGTYHYASARHELARLRGPASPSRIREYVPRSEYFARAPVLVFFTAVYRRQLWRYPYSRAYRAALIDAGHVCQTFLLTATWLRLAPFSVMGLNDSAIEKDLGIDGIQESVLYAAGMGHPPARRQWAPLPRGTFPIRPNPRLR